MALSLSSQALNVYSGPQPLCNWRVLGITSGGQGHRLPVQTILSLSLTLQSWDRRAQQGPNLPERAEVGHSQQKKQVVRRRMSPRLVLGPASHVGRFQSHVTCRKGKGESLSFTEATAVVHREPSWMVTASSSRSLKQTAVVTRLPHLPHSR